MLLLHGHVDLMAFDYSISRLLVQTKYADILKLGANAGGICKTIRFNLTARHGERKKQIYLE